jgi:transcriptional regulator with XRE-family HTH domain
MPNYSRSKIVEGKLLILESIRRKLAADGYKVGKQHLSKVFLGLRDPSVKLLIAMAKVLGKSMDETWELIGKVRNKYYYHPNR